MSIVKLGSRRLFDLRTLCFILAAVFLASSSGLIAAFLHWFQVVGFVLPLAAVLASTVNSPIADLRHGFVASRRHSPAESLGPRVRIANSEHSHWLRVSKSRERQLASLAIISRLSTAPRQT